jgi:beta-N-acetylhexosaminidase
MVLPSRSRPTRSRTRCTVRSRRSGSPLLTGVLAGVAVAVAAAVLPAAAAPVPVVRGEPVVASPSTPAPPPTELSGATPGLDRLPACTGVLAAMTSRERLAQRLMVGVDAADPAGAAETVRATQVGGVFLGGSATALLVGQRLRELQAVARVPVAVAVDDEGGRVQRVDDLDGELPSARRMAADLSPEQVRALGAQRGRALATRGVSMNLAPTVDVGVQPAGAVIGDRSFGADPDTVTRYAGAFAAGQRAAGIFTVLKHFPGHGRADGDSHQGRVTTPPLAELRATDLRPYADLVGPGGALAGGRTGVMVGHLDVPGLTGELPSSLDPAVYALLRGRYGFDGLVLTDDLGAMKAVTGSFELPEAVLRALDAGADVALWSSGASSPDRIAAILDVLESALADGRLDPAESDRASTRVLAAKGVCAARP